MLFGPASSCKDLPERPEGQRVASPMVVYHHSATIGVAVDALASFAPAVDKSICFESVNKSSNREVAQLFDHTVTATAALSITSILPASVGTDSPASSMSST